MNRYAKTGLEILGGVAGYLALTAGAYMPFVVRDANKKYNADCDYLLILGGNIIGAETPSPQLLERMKKAAEYLNEHPDVIAVPCGGCFRDGQKKSEAQVIADYLVSQGIDSSRIILEDNSTTTVENFTFGLPIVQKYNESRAENKISNPRIAFLSSSYHMHRAGVIAKWCGVDNVLRVSCITPGSAFQRYVREYFVAYGLITDRVGGKFNVRK